jgi:hypothetical protein
MLDKDKKILHALMEYDYNKDRELVLFSDRISGRDCLPLPPDQIPDRDSTKVE